MFPSWRLSLRPARSHGGSLLILGGYERMGQVWIVGQSMSKLPRNQETSACLPGSMAVLVEDLGPKHSRNWMIWQFTGTHWLWLQYPTNNGKTGKTWCPAVFLPQPSEICTKAGPGARSYRLRVVFGGWRLGGSDWPWQAWHCSWSKLPETPWTSGKHTENDGTSPFLSIFNGKINYKLPFSIANC